MTHGRRDEALPVSAVELLDRVQVAVLVTDLNGRILQCNRQAEIIFGVPRAELLGRSSADFAGEAVETSVIEEIAKIKMPDLNCFDVEAAIRSVKGTARSMGVDVA